MAASWEGTGGGMSRQKAEGKEKEKDREID
jgi:hypothetical protein